VKAHEKQLGKCLSFVRREIDTIAEQSYVLIKEDKLQDKDVYMSVYDMNQKLHHIKQILDTYCLSGKD
jgi:hypothetical protein